MVGSGGRFWGQDTFIIRMLRLFRMCIGFYRYTPVSRLSCKGAFRAERCNYTLYLVKRKITEASHLT